MQDYDRLLLCFRLYSTVDYDEELIWEFVQRHHGHISIRGDCIDFWIHRDYVCLLTLAYPDLTRQRSLDYC